MIKCSTILLLGAIVVSSYSCSRPLFGRGQSNSVVEKVSSVEKGAIDKRVVVQASKTDDKNDKSWLEIVERADESSELDRFDDPSTANTNINVSKFSASEMQHASISNYNPFDSNGELFFDLKRMSKEFHYPANGHLLSDFGSRGRGYHSGVDIKANKGDDIYAAFDGVVRMSSYYGGYGNVIVIRHYNGLETVYSHNTKNLVKIGDVVSAGDVIAYAGKTGRATGFHVHFEVRVKGQVINPNLLINTTEKRLQQKDLYIYNRSGKVYASNSNAKKRKEIVADDSAKEEQVVKSATVVASSNNKTTATTAAATIHKVVSGDTLSKIAKKYKTTIAELCRNNGVKPTTVLKLGQKIKVN